ncbi:GTPase [Rhizodiscina lignyota]|uniref:GTPase n=1 Tax=Rhizodiscina lignyota TaxID=1504668 RepID=A0A9P4M505_9PEZI|nr:GTPase [Rhizodiscina lignyota]
MKVGKPRSKRVPVRLRHKIEKASAAKQRKERKQAKKDPTWRTRLKKDPGIPNLFPYKDKILAEIEEKKRQKEADAARRKEDTKALKAGKSEDAQADDGAEEEGDDDVLYDYGSDEGEDETLQDDSNPMAALLASARARAVEHDRGKNAHGDQMDQDDSGSWEGFDEDDSPQAFTTQPRPDSSRRAFTSTFNNLLSSADVVLYVLDARDPLGTRSRAIERQITAADSGSKRLILILNKIDLVPPPVLKAWLVHLRRYFPTLPLRASNPAANAKTWDHKALTVKGTTETLVKALKSYAANQGMKRSISVGVIGYPNVGKSSVINALRSRLGARNDACPVGAEAGVTTSLREVKLDGKVKLIDSPGIVFASTDEDQEMVDVADRAASKKSKDKKVEEQARLILLNAIPPKEIDDPIPAVSLLLKRLTALSDNASSTTPFDSMLSYYGIPPLLSAPTEDGKRDITTDFLVQVARKRGRLGKGGVPNLNAAAFTVIIDWRDGRIQGWVNAPKLAVHVEGVDDVDMGGDENTKAQSDGKMVDQKKIVTEWAAEFKLEGLWGDGEGDGEEEARMDVG